MTTTTLKRAEKMETKGDKQRRHLMEAAAGCFRRGGFHGTSIARIAQASGMSQGHIGYYFPNKKAMVEAIVEQEEHDMAEFLRKMEQDNAGGDLAARMTRQTHAMIQRNSDPAYAGLVLEICAEAVRNPAVMQILQRSDHAIREQFFALVDRIGAPPGLEAAELHLRLKLIHSLLSGVMLCSLGEPDLDRAAMSRLINEVIGFLLGDAQ